MKKIETSMSLEIAVSLAFALGLFALSINVPGLSFLMTFLGIPFAVISMRRGSVWLLTSLFWFAIPAVAIGGLGAAIAALVYAVILSYALKYAVLNSSSGWKMLFIILIGAIITLTTVSDVHEAFSGASVHKEYEIMMNKAVDEVKVATLEANKAVPSSMKMDVLPESLELMKKTLPSAMFGVAVIMSFMIYPVSRFVFSRVGIEVPERLRITQLMLPRDAVFGMIVAGATVWMFSRYGFVDPEAAKINFVFIVASVFALQGLAMLFRYFAKFRLGSLLAFLVSTIVVAMTGTFALAFLGMVSVFSQSLKADVGR